MPDDQTTMNHLLTSGESLLVEAFAKNHGEGHVLLACHAAFPMVLTADLVYKIWLNFRSYVNEAGERCEIPYVAVSDLLLSPLCQPSGFQRFEMPANIRHTLLAVFQDDERFGKARLHELASFLKHYIEAAYRDADAIGQAIRNAQQLVVDAWLQPEKALQTLTQAFREAEQSPAEQVRLSNLVARFDLQWEAGLLAQDRQKPKQTGALLQYSQGLAAFHKTGDAYHAANLLKGVVQKGGTGMMLPLPGEVKTTVSNRLSLPKKGKLHALLVAIDEYHPEAKISPLRGCKNDARKLANWLERQHQSADSPWSEVSINTLFDEQATLSILEKRAEVLQNVETEDQVLIYFAGHARQDKPGDETDLICYDSLLSNMPLLTVSRFRNLVLSNARQQPYITVILDAQFTGSPNWLDPMNPKHVVFANTGLSEMGYEISGGEGFFTKYFIEALEQGSRDAGNAALFVDTLAGMAEDKLGEQQHPQFYATPLGAERPFLQALDPTRELKRQLRLSGSSLADLRKQLNIPDSATKPFWKAALTTYLSEKERADTPLFLFVFSDANGDLPGVQQEREQMKSLVDAQLKNTTIEAVFLENPDFEAVEQYFTAPEYRNRLHLFHFSGLDKENKPFYEPLIKKSHRKTAPIQQQSNIGSMSNIGNEPERPAAFGFLLADGLLPFFEFAPWLQYQQNLRLAFFNSCFSNHTATWATQLGAWNAIGTEGEVSDAAATKFAVAFYSKWLVGGLPMLGAFARVVETFRYDNEPLSGTHRSALREDVAEVPENHVPFQLMRASWLTTGWRGERFTDYYRISDVGLRALVFEYDSLDILEKKERVAKKIQLAQKMGEVINSVVADKRSLVGPHSSQGLLVGIVNAIRQRPTKTDAVVLLELAPMVEQQFVRYEWVEAVDVVMKGGMWPEERRAALEEVLKGFEEGGDEDLRKIIRPMMVNLGSTKFFLKVETLDTAGLDYIEQAWNEAGSNLVRAAAEKDADYTVIISDNTYSIAKPEGQRRWPLTPVLTGFNPSQAGLTVDWLQHISHWEFVKNLGDKYPTSSEWLLNLNSVELEIFKVETKGEQLLTFEANEASLAYEQQADGSLDGRIKIRLTNRFTQDLHVALLYLSMNFGSDGGLLNPSVYKLNPGESVWAFDGKMILLDYEAQVKEFNMPESLTLLKLIASTEFFDVTQLLLNDLPPPTATRSASRLRSTGRKAPVNTQNWITRLVTLRMPNPYYKELLHDFEMTFIPGGSFTMGWLEGRDGARNDHETPAHEVQLNDFYIGKYPVTQAQWRAVMGENPSHLKDDEQCPVEQVSWNNVQVFIKTLNEITGKNYRLPTEAEWEYAARGGNQSKNYQYSGSNDVKEVAWYDENSNKKSHPVGGLKPNELGLFDMSGNVWEWCQDWYDENFYETCKKSGVVINPMRSDKGVYRVIRGGDWLNNLGFCRTAYRGSYLPELYNGGIGFRLALSSQVGD